jgi:hypothetical protein
MGDSHFVPEKPDAPGDKKQTASPRVSDLQMERFHLGEMNPTESKSFQKRLDSDEALRLRYERLLEHERIFAVSHSPQKWVPRIESAAQKQSFFRSAFSAGTGGLWDYLGSFRLEKPWAIGVVAVAALLFTVVPIWFTVENPIGESIRTKGGSGAQEPRIQLYRQSLDSAVGLHPGDGVKAGDAVQVEIQSGGFSFAAIFSVDGKGETTWHWPSDAAMSARLPNKTGFRLPSAFLLDSAPGFERFYAVFSNDSVMFPGLRQKDSLIRESHRHAPEWLGQQLEPSLSTKAFELRKVP